MPHHHSTPLTHSFVPLPPQPNAPPPLLNSKQWATRPRVFLHLLRKSNRDKCMEWRAVKMGWFYYESIRYCMYLWDFWVVEWERFVWCVVRSKWSSRVGSCTFCHECFVSQALRGLTKTAEIYAIRMTRIS